MNVRWKGSKRWFGGAWSEEWWQAAADISV